MRKHSRFSKSVIKLVEKQKLFLSFINFMFWVCFLGSLLSFFMIKQSLLQLNHESKKVGVKQDEPL